MLPGALRLLRHLAQHGVPLAVATSTPRATLHAKLSLKDELRALLPLAVCGDEVSAAPAPCEHARASCRAGASAAHLAPPLVAPSRLRCPWASPTRRCSWPRRNAWAYRRRSAWCLRTRPAVWRWVAAAGAWCAAHAPGRAAQPRRSLPPLCCRCVRSARRFFRLPLQQACAWWSCPRWWTGPSTRSRMRRQLQVGAPPPPPALPPAPSLSFLSPPSPGPPRHASLKGGRQYPHPFLCGALRRAACRSGASAAVAAGV
jgi:hypothetical protein